MDNHGRAAVLAVLDEATEPMSPAEIALAAALPKNKVDQLLYRMGKVGEVTKLARGKYAASSRADLIGGHRNHTERKERTGHYSPKLTLITKPTGGSDAAV
jgi:DNA-binding IclR family transcriptional regulator